MDKLSQWISCEERLPDDFIPVLVYGDDIYIAHLEVKDFRRWYADHWNNEKLISVTHWMPLPSSPLYEAK